MKKKVTFHNTPTIKYSPEKIRELLNESLDAIHYWQSECLKHEAYIQKLESEIRAIRPSGTVRLPFGGFIR